MASTSRPKRQRLSKAKHRQLRKRQKARANSVRRELRRIETQAPSALREFLRALGATFTRPTYYRVVVLLLAGMLTVGSHSIVSLLRTVGELAPGAPSSYHRVFSRGHWSTWGLAHALEMWMHCWHSVLRHQRPLKPMWSSN